MVMTTTLFEFLIRTIILIIKFSVSILLWYMSLLSRMSLLMLTWDLLGFAAVQYFWVVIDPHYHSGYNNDPQDHYLCYWDN
uniref:Uncharacterized protein n=1 Tax=Moniliophthora roreri TaxID=221103 RepID=A0A0W0FUS0_MONRR